MESSARRHLLVLAAATLPGALVIRSAFAQVYPLRPVKFILGVAPGSVPDVATRQIADKLTLLLGQAVFAQQMPQAFQCARRPGGQQHPLALLQFVARDLGDGLVKIGIGICARLGVAPERITERALAIGLAVPSGAPIAVPLVGEVPKRGSSSDAMTDWAEVKSHLNASP